MSTTASNRRWWQYLFPRYGNWGAPGWSAGAWSNDPAATDWTIPAVDAMDALFKEHDRAYQTGGCRVRADCDLVLGLHRVEVSGLYGRCYRVGAIIVFSAHAGWQSIRG